MCVANKLKDLKQDTCEICVLIPFISSFNFMKVFLERPWELTAFFSFSLMSRTGGRALAALLKKEKKKKVCVVLWCGEEAKQVHVANAPMLTGRNVPSSPPAAVKSVI